jgi:glycosyltransferase involved in cell wall biosynthesis
MKVLLYSKTFLPEPGGIQTAVFELARGLAAWRLEDSAAGSIDVIVVTQTPGRPEEDKSFPFRVIRHPGFLELAGLLLNTDIIHLAGPTILPLSLGLLLRKPVIVEHHGFQAACPNGLLFFEPTQTPCPGHFMAARYGKCLECNRVTLGSIKSLSMLLLTHVRRWLSNQICMNIIPTNWLGTVLNLKRTRTVYHGISPSGAATSVQSTIPIFAFQGRLVTTKGVRLLLDAVQQLRDEGYKFKLKVIGNGPEQESLEKLAAGLDGDVDFLGYAPGGRLEELLADVSTVVMPSLAGEVFGLVAAENMLRGKLVVVSDIGALCEVVGDTGLIFTTGSVSDLASCMRQVLDKPLLASTLGSAARSRIMRVFSQDDMIQGHVSVYQEAILH